MYKIIELKSKNVLINVNNIAQIQLIDDKIIFHLSNSFTITANVQPDAKRLYKCIKKFILDSQAKVMQLE